MTHPGERRLWLSVLLEGLREAAEGKDAFWPWTKDFQKVCDLADLDPMVVQTVFQIAKGRVETSARNRAGRACGSCTFIPRS